MSVSEQHRHSVASPRRPDHKGRQVVNRARPRCTAIGAEMRNQCSSAPTPMHGGAQVVAPVPSGGEMSVQAFITRIPDHLHGGHSVTCDHASTRARGAAQEGSRLWLQRLG